jgi:hypothetical protein
MNGIMKMLIGDKMTDASDGRVIEVMEIFGPVLPISRHIQRVFARIIERGVADGPLQ